MGASSPRLLLIETSGYTMAVGIADVHEGKIIAQHLGGPVADHSRELPAAVHELLVSTGTSPEDIRYVAVTVGPGSFTGLRLGLSFARGFIFGREDTTHLVGVYTCEVVYWMAVRKKGIDHVKGVRSFCVIQAHRRGAYVKALSECASPEGFEILSWDEIRDRIVAGGGVCFVPEPLPDPLRSTPQVYSSPLMAEDMLKPALSRIERKEFFDRKFAGPVYIFPYKPHKPSQKS